MDLVRRIEGLIAPSLDAMGYAVVRVRVTGSRRRTLQVMAECRDRPGMTVEDCTRISRAVSAILDVEDPIVGAYTLEVSSPGIDRPLVSHEDFARFVGFEAKVELREAMGGRKRFRGRLLGVTGMGVCIEGADGEVELPFAEIGNAKLVLTDELIEAMSNEERV
jgi:ribosome maturation factor RimP